MSDTNGTNETTTPTTTATNKVSPMIAVRAAFEAGGGKYKDGKAIPSAAQLKMAKAAGKELTAAQAGVDAAEAALAAAKEKVYDASRIVMEATGGTQVTIGGREFVPMSRGERVFFRPAGNRSSVEL